MEYLNSQQLAFILSIDKEDARAKMCVAWAAEKSIPLDAEWPNVKVVKGKTKRVQKKFIETAFPDSMPIEMLGRRLNLPLLQSMVDDIVENYTKRPEARKFILQDYPEKKIDSLTGNSRVKLPPALRSMLPTKVKKEILDVWHQRFDKGYLPVSVDKM